MKAVTVKFSEEQMDDIDEMVSRLKRETGLRISRHSVLVKAVSEYVSERLETLRKYEECGMLENLRNPGTYGQEKISKSFETFLYVPDLT
jgi:ribosome maturation protein Sdo1